jgi:hypothetical protein
MGAAPTRNIQVKMLSLYLNWGKWQILTAPLTGLRNEEIQDNPVTGAAFDPQWQDAWGDSDLDVDL